MARYAKAITVLVLTALGVLLKEIGVEEVPGDELELVVSGIVTSALVYLVPNH